MIKRKESLMTTMVEPMVVIYLGWKQTKKNCVLGSFGHRFLKTALKQLKSSSHTRFLLEKWAHNQLPCFLLSLLAHLQSVGSTIPHVILLQHLDTNI